MAEKKPGWYNVPGKGERYWTGSEYRFMGPSTEGDGRDRIDVLGWLGDKFRRSQEPLSPERQARSEAQKRFNAGNATAADLKLLRSGKSKGGGGSSNSPQTPPKSSGGSEVRFKGKVYPSLDDPAYKKAQEEELERQRKRGGGFSDIRGGDGYKPDGGGERFPDPRPSVTGRDDTRENGGGVVQTGTDMSGANALLRRMGIDTVQYGQFESNSLPSQGDPGDNSGKTDTEAELVTNTPENYTKSGQSPTNVEELPTPETNIVNNGLQLGSRERYRNEFMADRGDKTGAYSESMVGLRAADASKGLLYASGKYWREGSDGKFEEISKADYKSIKRGDQHAQQFAREKIELAKAIDSQPTYEQAQKDAQEYDYGSDGMYGGYDTYTAKPSEADYPEQTAVAPADTEISETMERISKLDLKKAQGDFDKFIKDNPDYTIK